MGSLEKMAEKAGYKPAESAEEEASEGMDAASDVLSAIAAKDAKALNLALTRHYESCQMGGSEEE